MDLPGGFLMKLKKEIMQVQKVWGKLFKKLNLDIIFSGIFMKDMAEENNSV